MELNDLFLWTVLLSTVLSVFRFLPHRQIRGLLINNLLVILVTLISLPYAPDLAGFIGGGVWLVFVLTPSLLNRRMSLAIMAGDYAAAARAAAVMRCFQFTPTAWRLPNILRAIDAAENGRTEEAITALKIAISKRGYTAGLAQMHLGRITMNWQSVIDYIQNLRQDERKTLRQYTIFIPSYLRALGETGRIEDLIAAYDLTSSMLYSPIHIYTRRLAMLSFFAFTGQPDEVAGLFRTSLFALNPDVQRLWFATALMTAGDSTTAARVLISLSPDASSLTRRLAEYRLTHPLPLTHLSDHARNIIETTRQTARHESRNSIFTRPTRRPVITQLLILANCGMFLAETLLGSPTDPETLLRLGAVNIDAVLLDHQYWRLLTADFLHFGIAHLLANMLGLWFLGRGLEPLLGRLRYAVIYLVAGVLAFLAVVWISHLRQQEIDLAVGASGSVMALVGAMAAILLKNWRRGGGPLASRQLRGVIGIVLIQVAFDWLTPQVSFTAHTTGLLTGFAMTYLWMRDP